MSQQINDIVFYQLLKPRTKNLAKGLRRCFEYKKKIAETFEQKKLRIKQTAEKINKNL